MDLSLFVLGIAAGVWLLLQFLYLLVIECVRRRDRAAPTTPYALGSLAAENAAILVHGFADTPQAWRREAEMLATRGWRVLVPELSHDGTEADWLPLLVATLREAKAAHGRVVLWGHSMGGAMALAAARRETPDALILWAPFFAPRLGRTFTKLLYRLHRLLFLYPFVFTYFPALRQAKGSPASTYRVRRVIPVRTFAAMLRTQRLAQGEPPACPTLLLLSRRDRVVDNRAALRALPAAGQTFAAAPESGHALTNAADWAANLDASLAWLNRHAQSV